jgi:hypothetical protein
MSSGQPVQAKSVLEALPALERLAGEPRVFVHWEVVAESAPVYLACLALSAPDTPPLIFRPGACGLPTVLRDILLSSAEKVCTREAGALKSILCRQFLGGTHVGEGECAMWARMGHFTQRSFDPAASPVFYPWGADTYSDDAVAYLHGRLTELEMHAADEAAPPSPPPPEPPPVYGRMELAAQPGGVSSLAWPSGITAYRWASEHAFVAPNSMWHNTIAYLREYTFTPDDRVYRHYAESFKYARDKSVRETRVFQGENHDRMLKVGSTQINTCGNSVEKGAFVRINERLLAPKERGVWDRGDAAELNSVDGAVSWSARTYKVESVVPGDAERPRRYKLAQVGGLFYQRDLCPVENIEKGAIVRIRLAANNKYRKQIEGVIKTGNRHFKYNHSFSRALFRVERLEEIGTEGDQRMRYFLSLEWSPVGVFKHSAWEVDWQTPENLWSYEHYEKRMYLGEKKFTGFTASDLLRVDRQTEVLMRTSEGKEKYERCLRKCMTLGRNPVFAQGKQPRRPPTVATIKELQTFGNNETRIDNCRKRHILWSAIALHMRGAGDA